MVNKKSDHYASVKNAVKAASVVLLPTTTVFISGIFCNAVAGSGNTNVNINANINSSCKVSSPLDVAFGTYDATSENLTSPRQAIGGISIKCTNKTSANLSISLGDNASNAAFGVTRAMKGTTTTTEYLSYELYQDAGRSNYWGPTVADDMTYTAATGNVAPYTIYAHIPAGQTEVSAQEYSDVVVVTTTF